MVLDVQCETDMKRCGCLQRLTALLIKGKGLHDALIKYLLGRIGQIPLLIIFEYSDATVKKPKVIYFEFCYTSPRSPT